MAIDVGFLNILVGLGLKDGAGEKLGDDIAKGAGPAAEKAGALISEKLTKSLDKAGKNLTKSVTGPLLALGGVAVAGALSVDEGLDKIRVSTGATGDELTQLQDDFKAVASTSTTSFAETADVVALLNQRLGLTGEPLQKLAGQLTDLQQITGEAANTEDITKLFAAFQIPAEKQSETLDLLFRASQQTGVSFNDLAASAAGNAKKFQELGFSFTDSVALLGQLEKSGLNVDGVLAGLNKSILKSVGKSDDIAKIEGKIAKAQGDVEEQTLKLAAAEQKLAELRADPKSKQSAILAAEAAIEGIKNTLTEAQSVVEGGTQAIADAAKGTGVDTAQFLDQTIGKIQELLASGDRLGAQAIAKETFGKGFVEVLAAIESGSFDTKALVENIQNGTDSITGLADETKDLPELWKETQNQLTLAIEPLGKSILPIVQDVLVSLTPIITDLADAFANLSPGTQKFLVIIGGVAAAIGPTLVAFGKVATGVNALVPLFTKLWGVLAANPWILVAAAAIAVVVLIIKNWDKVKAFFLALWDAIKVAAEACWNGIKVAAEFVYGVVIGIWNGIKATAKAVWDGIVFIVKTAVDLFVGYIKLNLLIIVGAWNALTGVVAAVWNGILSIIKTVGEGIVNLVKGYVNLVIGFWKGVGQAIGVVWNGLKTAAQAAFSFVASIVSKYIGIWLGVLKTFGSALGSVWKFFKDGAQTAFNFVKGIIDGISRLIRGVVDTVKNLPSLLGDAIGSVIKKIPGGDKVLGLLSKIPGLAEGGPATAGKPYIVGEQGPELFVPRMSGTVISNPNLAGLLNRGGDQYQITVVNPVAEPASTSLPNALRRAGYLRGRS